MADRDEDIRSLQLAYDDIVRERDRLRSAQASVTRQLGPLPVSAGIAISVVGALARNRVDEGWLIVASVLLLLLVVVGILFSVLAPYRRLRAEHADELAREATGGRGSEQTAGAIDHKLGFNEQLPTERWLKTWSSSSDGYMGHCVLPDDRSDTPSTSGLQDGFDAERTGLYLVQLLFVALIAALVIGLLGGR